MIKYYINLICIFLIRDGKKIDTYDGAKTLDGLETYLKKMKKGGSKDTKKKTAKKPTTPVKTKKKKKTAKAEL